jgi:hypothetical protein
MTDFTTWERQLLILAVEYYLLNKQVDPIAGQIPFKVEMTDLYNTLKASCPRYD